MDFSVRAWKIRSTAELTLFSELVSQLWSKESRRAHPRAMLFSATERDNTALCLCQTVELALRGEMGENWRAEQPSYHPGLELKLWVGPLQHPPHLWILGAYEGYEPINLKLQDLHNTGKQLDIQRRPRENPLSVVQQKPEVSNKFNDSW